MICKYAANDSIQKEEEVNSRSATKANWTAQEFYGIVNENPTE